MKLFAGLQPPDEVIKDLATTVDRLSLASARPVEPRLWHVTLAYIGEVDGQRLSEVTTSLSEAIMVSDGFGLRISGGGTFGTSVLFAGVDGANTVLAGLSADIRAARSRFGLPFDDRPFRPHLTLARPRGRLTDGELESCVATLNDYRSRDWVVSEVLLYRADSLPHYEVLERFPLRSAGLRHRTVV